MLLMMYIIAKGGILQLRRLYFLPIQFLVSLFGDDHV